MSRRSEVIRGTADIEAASCTESRPLRRDAELNLARIVVAARDVFAELGYEASMEQIAARAEVGIGTLYRRFPTKADLFAAVVDAATERTCQIADEVLADVEPAETVFEFVRRCVATPSCWRAVTSRRPWSGAGADRALAGVMPAIGRIVARSQEAGSVRDDLVATDLLMTLMSVRALADLCDARAPGTSDRFLDLALDGFRPGRRSPLHPPMTSKQLARVLTNP
jgi:AcrR family transcriptional regulator